MPPCKAAFGEGPDLPQISRDNKVIDMWLSFEMSHFAERKALQGSHFPTTGNKAAGLCHVEGCQILKVVEKFTKITSQLL